MDKLIVSPGFGLEPENFRIDSSAWETLRTPNGLWVKADQFGRITEFLDGEFAGEQLFTLDAALEETRKAGKAMPNRKQWLAIVRAAFPETVLKFGTPDGDTFALGGKSGAGPLSPKRCGYRDCGSGAHYYAGGYGYYWANAHPDPGSRAATMLSFADGGLLYVGRTVRGFGYSVRCLKT